MPRGRGHLSMLYTAVINSVDKVVPQAARPFWKSPAGPKTVFFWGPLGKWGLALAGFGDLINLPAQNVSLNQSSVLAATSLIWSRYSVVITPKNYSLLAVNVVVLLTQAFLVAKHLHWRCQDPKVAAYYHPRRLLPYNDS